MRRGHRLCLLTAVLWAGSLSFAWPHEALICARPEVLDFVRNAILAHEAHVELLDGTVREVSTTRRDIVSCAVMTRVDTYPPSDPANYATSLVEPRYFLVRRLSGGFEVEFGR